MAVPDFTGEGSKNITQPVGGGGVPDFTRTSGDSRVPDFTRTSGDSRVPDFTKRITSPLPSEPPKKSFLRRLEILSGRGKSIRNKIRDFIAGAAEEPTYTGEKGEVLRNLPGEIVRTLLPGAAAISDYPEEFGDISTLDIAKEVPGVVGKMLIEPALSYPLTFYGATSQYVLEPLGLGRAPGVGEAGTVKAKLPIIGDISNVQERMRRELEARVPETPLEIAGFVAKHTGFEILNGLYGASLVNMAVSPRVRVLTPKGKVVPPKGKFPQQPGPKTFQFFESAYTEPVPRSVFDKIIAQLDIPVRTNYNPNNPIFFRTSKILADGTATGQFFQIRPSYLNTFVSKLKGVIKDVPLSQIIPVANTPKSIGLVKAPVTAPPIIPPPTVVTPPKPAPTPPVVTPTAPIVTPKPPVVTPTAPVVTPTAPVVTPKPPVVTPTAPVSVPPEIITAVQKAKTFEDFGDNILNLYPEAKLPTGEIDFQKVPISKFILDEATYRGQVSLEEVYAAVQKIEKTLRKPSTIQKPPKGQITLKPAEKPIGPIEIGKKEVLPPKQLVTKSQVKDIVRNLGGEVVFKIEGEGRSLRLTYKDKKTDIKIIPEALGLVPANLKAGGTVKITSEDLKKKGVALRGVDREGKIVAARKLPKKPEVTKKPIGKPEATARTREDLIKAIEQLNKFGQSQAVLRKTGGVSKKALGQFVSPKTKKGKKLKVSKKGIIELREETVMDPRQYMETLSHELGHALDYSVNGEFGRTLEIFGKDLSKADKATLLQELKEVTNQLVGEAVAKGGAGYYYKREELFARFLETMFAKPGTLEAIAPTAVDLFQAAAVRNPIIAEYLEAVAGTIDKGELKYIFARDMRQTFMKYLGTRNGNQAWDQYVNYRAMKQRAKFQIEKLIESKFVGLRNIPFKKGFDIKQRPIAKRILIPDSQELLFNSIESIKITTDDVPEFGTRDMLYAKNKKEEQTLKENGYKPIKNEAGKQVYELVNGEQYPRYAKLRFTPKQGKAFYDALSPQGKTLVRDFTAHIDEAKDYFNREIIKDVHKINSNLEGWVHRYWEGKPAGVGRDVLKTKIASARKFRKGEEGYVKDFRKAMEKSLIELETEKAYNHFMENFFPVITRPLAKGEKPDKGWVEVFGDIKKGGVGLKYELGKTTIIKDGKSIQVPQPRYQMPADIYEQFERLRGLAIEASTVMRILSSIMRYWRVNILFHMGSNATNFISGGIQQSANIVNHFYKEALTGDITFPQTRSDIYSTISTVFPRGWQEAPDWIYGGDQTNLYGQFTGDEAPGIKALEESVDVYADKALKLYGTVERYWKKVIVNAHNTNNLQKLNTITKEGLKLPTKEEEELIAMINREIDTFALDYDNIPVWMKNYKKSAIKQAVKPFAVFVYKITKLYTTLMERAFDGTLPWQTRLASILTMGTMIAASAHYIDRRREKQETPRVGEEVPGLVSAAGQLYIGTDKYGVEKFTRISKYPFVNLSEAGLQIADGNTEEAYRVIQNMIGSVGPGGDVAAAVLGYKQDYQQWMTPGVIAGQSLSTFVPASRMLSDISAYKDPYKRKQETFWQGFTRLYPTSNPELQKKLHGAARTVQIPLEGNIFPSGDFFEKASRTTTDTYIRNYKNDILLQALAGIYIKRIDPDVAEAFNIRDEFNALKEEVKFDPFSYE